MKIAPLPVNEDLRLNDLLSYNILDSEREKHFDDLAELAADICNCPVVGLSFIDKDRIWLKASVGMGDATHTGRDVGLCAHTILQKELLIVKNAREDKRFYDNPLVTGGPKIVFYAGAPIISSNGFVLGAVGVVDNKVREDITPEKIRSLAIIAAQVSKLLELRAKSNLIIKHAEKQIAAEKRNNQLAVKEGEKAITMIAYQLQENLAQSLAATRLFLESAEESEEMKPYFLKKTKDSIAQMIDEVRSLSKSITPTTFQNADYFYYIKEFGESFGKQHNMNIRFGKADVVKNYELNIGLNLFRIIQYQLEIAKNCQAKNVVINITTGANIVVAVNDDGQVTDAIKAENTILYNKIATRAELIGCIVHQKSTPYGNVLQIKDQLVA